MDKTVSAADASRRFLELLQTVRKGRSVIVTIHGKHVAKLIPIVEDERDAARTRSALLARLRTEKPVIVGRWTRDELYDDVS
jgi:prevent-host-death family protein